MSPERRRRAVSVLQERYRVSERLVCHVVGQHRSTQRYSDKVVSIEEGKLRHRLREIAAEHIRCGRRMPYRLLRREGWGVNHKRVQRVWREEALQQPISRKSELGLATALCGVTGLSIPTGFGPWISSLMPRLTVSNSNS